MSTVNSGITMRVIPMSRYALTGSLAAGATVNIPLAQHIDATTFQEADLMVRFHTGTSALTGTNAEVYVSLVAEGYDFEDPASQFTSNTLPTFGAGNTVGINATNTTFPLYGVAQLVAPFGRFLQVYLTLVSGNPVGTMTFVISVDLVLKGGDASGLPMAPNSYRGYRIM